MKLWKKLKYWQRGALSGIVVSALAFIFTWLGPEILSRLLLYLPRDILVNKLNISLGHGEFITRVINDVIVATILTYPLIGFVGGLALDKFKNQKKVKSKHK